MPVFGGEPWPGRLTQEAVELLFASFEGFEAASGLARCALCHEDFAQGDQYGAGLVENWHEEVTLYVAHLACLDARDAAENPPPIA